MKKYNVFFSNQPIGILSVEQQSNGVLSMNLEWNPNINEREKYYLDVVKKEDGSQIIPLLLNRLNDYERFNEIKKGSIIEKHTDNYKLVCIEDR